MELVVGRIGRPHGVRGEVTVEVRTDDPDTRFAEGARLDTDPPERGPLTVVQAREHHGRLLVAFEGFRDREGAETLRNTLLVADSATSGPTDDDEYWDHELVGLLAYVDGAPLGAVSEVIHTPGGDLLSITREGTHELLVPFVAEVVPEVDIAGGRVVVDPPEGLLDL